MSAAGWDVWDKIIINRQTEKKTYRSTQSSPGNPKSRLVEPLPDFFLKPSFIPIFLNGLSPFDLGLYPGYGFKSPDGGVVGGVIGSSTPGLGNMLTPESSVSVGEPESPLVVDRRLPALPNEPKVLVETPIGYRCEAKSIDD
jgi:hypothetical protein